MPQVLKEEVRKSIITAATIEFYEKGYKGSSIRSIVKAASVTTGNFYRYFESKEKLYEEIVGKAYRILNTILVESTNEQIKLEEIPTKEKIGVLQQEDSRAIVMKVIKDVLFEFDKERLSLLILLKEGESPESNKTRIGLQRWFKAHFDILYDGYDITEYLAYSFIEGLIHIAMTEEDDMEKRLEELITFFFLRGGL